jgi:hypothetical protein
LARAYTVKKYSSEKEVVEDDMRPGGIKGEAEEGEFWIIASW